MSTYYDSIHRECAAAGSEVLATLTGGSGVTSLMLATDGGAAAVPLATALGAPCQSRAGEGGEAHCAVCSRADCDHFDLIWGGLA